MINAVNAAPNAATEGLPRKFEYDERDLYVWLFDGKPVPKTLFERVLVEAEREVDGLIAGAVLSDEDILGPEFLDQLGLLRRTMALQIMSHLALQKIVSLELIDCGLGNATLFRVK